MQERIHKPPPLSPPQTIQQNNIGEMMHTNEYLTPHIKRWKVYKWNTFSILYFLLYDRKASEPDMYSLTELENPLPPSLMLYRTFK